MSGDDGQLGRLGVITLKVSLQSQRMASIADARTKNIEPTPLCQCDRTHKNNLGLIHNEVCGVPPALSWGATPSSAIGGGETTANFRFGPVGVQMDQFGPKSCMNRRAQKKRTKHS